MNTPTLLSLSFPQVSPGALPSALFSWYINSEELPLQVQLQVSTDIDFSDIILDTQDVNDVGDSHYTFQCDGLLISGNTYYWRVKASHYEDVSDWSQVWPFSTWIEFSLITEYHSVDSAKLAWDGNQANGGSLIGVDRFVVQKSLGGDVWEDVATISNESMEYVDDNLSVGQYYYRIKIVYNDESLDYSSEEIYDVPEEVDVNNTKIIRYSDKVRHGGSLYGSDWTTCVKTYAEGELIMRIGDLVYCTKKHHHHRHGWRHIVTGSDKTFVEGIGVARDGDVLSCGGILVSLAEKTYAR